MKRLIFDHFRRWSWVLALVAVLEFGLGWHTASRPKEGFEFYGLMLALWTGANLIQYDLKKGLARGVTVLPLTARQIGRSWWLASVAIPALGLAVLLFMGAGLLHHLHPGEALPVGLLTLASLFNLAWLSTAFNCAFAPITLGGKLHGQIGDTFISVISVAMLFGGMLLCQNASRDPVRSSWLLGVGALLTVGSWFRSGRCLSNRAGFRALTGHRHSAEVHEALERLKAQRPPATGWGLRRRIFDAQIRRFESNLGLARRGGHQPSGAYGGVAFLIRTTFTRTFPTLLAMVSLMALIRHWQGRALSRELDIMLFATLGSFMSCFFIFFLQPMPVLRHLRFLRTLPISATRLAAAMMAFAILPLAALGAVVTGVAGLSLGPAVAIMFLKSYTLILAPASLCVFFTVWQGARNQVYVWLLLILFGFQLGPMWLQRFIRYPEIPDYATGALVASCVLLAFLLTRCALLRSSVAYRVHAGSTDNHLPWSPGR